MEEHRLTGTFQPSRHADIKNPEPPKGIPEPPKPLEGDAAEEWARMIYRLQASKTISLVDDAAVYQYCCLYADTEQLVIEKAEARQAVDTLQDSQGDVAKEDLLPFFIELGKMKKLAASYDSKLRSNRVALIKALCEFGLTPASRGRVKVAHADEPNDPFSEFDAEPQ